MSRAAIAAVALATGACVVIVPVATIGVALWVVLSQDSIGCHDASGGGPGGGESKTGDRVWSAEQMDNARTIVQTTASRSLPRTAAVIAMTAAITESNLRNVHYGHSDSLGLFQQRPSMGWGNEEQVTNPVYATGKFLDRLAEVPGWDTPGAVSNGQAAQAVERSAYPQRYQPNEPAAQQLVGRFWPGPENPAPPADASSAVNRAALVRTGCPDEGQSTLPPDDAHLRQLPPGFLLPADPRQRMVAEYAVAQLGKPYVWGAKGPEAFDCSGLVQSAWAHAGVALPSGTTGQVHAGTPVPSLEAAQPGDLLLIPGSLGSPSNPRHVGLFLGQGLVIDAYDEKTGVVVSPVDRWAGRIVAIRRPAPAESAVLAGGPQP